MKSQLQSYLSLFTLTTLGLSASGCGARSTDATDTQTSWLSSCEEDSDCGSHLTCLCGVCTRGCDAEPDCRDLANQAHCLDASHCGEVNAVCALSQGDLQPPHETTDVLSVTPSSSTSQSPAASAPDETTTHNDEASSSEEASITSDAGAPQSCPAAPEGTSVEVTVLAETTCFGDTFGQWATSQEELDAILAYCGVQVEASFDGNLVYVGVFSDRPTARFGYVLVVD